jgi:hypothetical protein
MVTVDGTLATSGLLLFNSTVAVTPAPQRLNRDVSSPVRVAIEVNDPERELYRLLGAQ